MAVQLGCNYSPALFYLLERDGVDIDWIKLSRLETVDANLALASSARPVLLHILPHAGQRPGLWDDYTWSAFDRQLRLAESPHAGLHFDLRAEDWDEPLDVRYQPREQAAAMLRRLADGVRAVQQRVNIPVLVENMDYGHPEVPRLAVQPESFWQVLEETGAGLLLDLSHLRCTAYHLGVDERAYARALPLHAVREVHISGPRLEPNGLCDRHYALQEEDYALLAWLLGFTEPAIVTLEYGGTGQAFETPERNDPQALEAQLVRLRQLLP